MIFTLSLTHTAFVSSFLSGSLLVDCVFCTGIVAMQEEGRNYLQSSVDGIGVDDDEHVPLEVKNVLPQPKPIELMRLHS